MLESNLADKCITLFGLLYKKSTAMLRCGKNATSKNDNKECEDVSVQKYVCPTSTIIVLTAKIC